MTAKVTTRRPITPQGEQSVFLINILESSTGYSIIGKANPSVLHTPADIAAGKLKEIMAAASGVIVPRVATVSAAPVGNESCARRAAS